jgi:hypothetical protein
MQRAAIETGSEARGYRRRCEHCGRGLEVIIVPVEGKSFTFPQRLLDQLFRITDRIEQMNVKMIQISRIGRKASEPQSVVPGKELPAER